jgi:hypothetical protein
VLFLISSIRLLYLHPFDKKMLFEKSVSQRRAAEMGWGRGKRKDGLFWGCGFSGDREFPQKPFHDLLVSLHRFSVGD